MVRIRLFLRINTLQRADNANKADKLRTRQQLEALHNKYVGTGHADTTSFEYRLTSARDTFASFAGHPTLLEYHCLASGDASVEETRIRMLESMVRPIGPAPQVEET